MKILKYVIFLSITLTGIANIKEQLPPGNYDEFCSECRVWKRPKMLGNLVLGYDDILACKCFYFWELERIGSKLIETPDGKKISVFKGEWKENNGDTKIESTIDYGDCPDHLVTTKRKKYHDPVSGRTNYWGELKCAK